VYPQIPDVEVKYDFSYALHLPASQVRAGGHVGGLQWHWRPTAGRRPLRLPASAPRRSALPVRRCLPVGVARGLLRAVLRGW